MSSYSPNPSHTICYASGIPANNQLKHGTVNENNMVPFNGMMQPSVMNTLIPNVNCSRNDYRNMTSTNYTDCKDECLKDNNCQVWSFDNSSNKCYLNNISHPCVPDNNYVSGFVKHAPPLGRGDRVSTVLSDSVFTESPYKTVNSTTMNNCQNDCINDPNCNRWSYANDKCALYNGKTSIVAKNPGAFSGEIYNRKIIPTPYFNQ
jgi:hypothetical protein